MKNGESFQLSLQHDLNVLMLSIADHFKIPMKMVDGFWYCEVMDWDMDSISALNDYIRYKNDPEGYKKEKGERHFHSFASVFRTLIKRK